LVDDVDAASGLGRRSVHASAAAVPAALHGDVAGRGDLAGRELRRAPVTLRSITWLVGIMLIALNLRPAVASVPPLADTIAADLHLGAAALGVLTTLPVLCMGLFAPVGAFAARRFGSTRVLAAAVVLVAVGTALRAIPQLWLLYC